MDIKYGLSGVTVDQTSISQVIPEKNSLAYRGYLIQDLVEQCCFEEVAYLLLNKKLPNETELEEFREKEKNNRYLSSDLIQLLDLLPIETNPMDVLRTAISYLGCSKNSESENREHCSLELLSTTPTILGALYRKRKGLKRIDPNQSLGFVDNFFHLCFGTTPEVEIAKAFNASLILYAEHSFNASTFTARVITSTRSDIYSAIVGAIGCLKGYLHGGANEAVMHTMLEIGDPKRAANWLINALEQKKKIMGFGHRIYRLGDSRVPSMKQYFFNVAQLKNGKKWVDIYEILEQLMIEKKNIYPNLDFPTGPMYYLMGFDIDFFTPIFVMSRITGWMAHVFEQQRNNKLIRPLSHYIGEQIRSIPPIEQR